MKKIIVTPKRLDIERLAETETYLTNGNWLIDKRYINNKAKPSLESLKKYHDEIIEPNQPEYLRSTGNIKQETCQKVVDRALDAKLTALTIGEPQEATIERWTYNGVPFVDCTNEKNQEITRLNAYYIEFMRKLGATSFYCNYELLRTAIVCRNKKGEMVGLIMPLT